MKALAVSTAKRASQAPDIDHGRSRRAGFRDLALVRAGGAGELPAAITARLNKEINAIVSDPAVIKALDLQAMQPDPIPLARMGDLIRNDLTRWREIAAKAGVKAE